MVRDTPMVHNERTKRKKQKLGFPIEDFGNDGVGRSSPLNISIIPLSLIPECLYSLFRHPWMVLSGVHGF